MGQCGVKGVAMGQCGVRLVAVWLRAGDEWPRERDRGGGCNGSVWSKGGCNGSV